MASSSFGPNVLSEASSFGGDLSPELRAAIYRVKVQRRDSDDLDRITDRIRSLLYRLSGAERFRRSRLSPLRGWDHGYLWRRAGRHPPWLEKIRSSVLGVVDSVIRVGNSIACFSKTTMELWSSPVIRRTKRCCW